jgi:hypothetical protein
VSNKDSGSLWLFGPPQTGELDPVGANHVVQREEAATASAEATEVQDAIRSGSESMADRPAPGPPTNVQDKPNDPAPDMAGDLPKVTTYDGSSSAPWSLPPASSAPVGQYPESASSSETSPTRLRLPLVVVGVLVIGLVLGGGAIWFLARPGADVNKDALPSAASGTSIQPTLGSEQDPASTGSGSSADPSEAVPSATSPSSPSEADRRRAQRAAHKQLESLADDGRAAVSLNGQNAAMIASKWNGVKDSLQTADNGSHVFYYSDILAEHDRLAAGDNLGAQVVLLRSTDYGRRVRSPHGKVLYVTLAVGGFASQADVRSWCNIRFADLSRRERANNCVPTKLTE